MRRFRHWTGRTAAPAAGPPAAASLTRPAASWWWRMLAGVLITLRWPVVLGWAAAAVVATLYLPALASSPSLSGIVPAHSPAARAEADATRYFGEPLASAEVTVVQRDPHRFPLAVQTSAARAAATTDRDHGAGIPGLAGAVPIANTGRVFPGSRERSTTIITYLFFRPGTGTAEQTADGWSYARHYLSAPADHLAGVTGPVPAEQEQGNLIITYLPLVEACTVAAIAVILGLQFRTPGAPLASLACSAVTYAVAVRLVGWVAKRAALSVPPDLAPVLVVLLLGVTTDYSVFFLTGMRTRVRQGQRRLQAARHTTAEFMPIIVAAGLVVSAGIAALGLAGTAAVRVLGPTLALTVVTAMAVSVTLMPALIAIFGGLLFHGVRRRAAPAPAAGGPRAAEPDGETPRPADGPPPSVPGGSWRDGFARLVTWRPVAALTTAVCVAALVAAGWSLTRIRLGFPLVTALPATAPAFQAQAAAAHGFVPGVLAPAEILVIAPGVTARQQPLARLQRELASQPGVAGVLGPATLPQVQQESGVHLSLAPSGQAARYVVFTHQDPLGPVAIRQIDALRQRLPSLGRTAGLGGARFETGGQTALAGEAITDLTSTIGRVGLITIAVIMVLMALFLRALLAPVYLMACSVLALLAALGLTTWIFQGLLHYPGLAYYVPFAAGALLISLGSDYNIFVVGRVWEEARRRPLRDAVRFSAPRASRAITTAALALAAGFAVLALVPLAQFRELATIMVLGILIDAFVVRSLLVPALIVGFGAAGQWPGHHFRGRTARGREPEVPGQPVPQRSH